MKCACRTLPRDENELFKLAHLVKSTLIMQLSLTTESLALILYWNSWILSVGVGIPGEVTRWWARCMCHKEDIHPPDPLALAGNISRGGQDGREGVGRAGTGARTRLSPPDQPADRIPGH